MNVLVTGGAGYIGSVLVPALLAKGHRVTVVDNFLYRQGPLLDCCHDPHLTIVRGDVRDERVMRPLVQAADAIFPLACLVGAPLCDRDPVGAKSVNHDAIEMLLRLRSTGQWIVFPTTNSGYGVGEDGVFCTEETPLRPISLYGRLKVEIEQRLLRAGNCITLRLATVFGVSPRMRLDLLVNDFTYRALRDRVLVLFEADFKRNYLHVRDASHAFIHCLENFERMCGEPYNVGMSDANLSKLELAERIKEAVPELHIFVSEVGHDPDQRNYIVSNAKIEATGYRTAVSLEAGISELVRAYPVLSAGQYANV